MNLGWRTVLIESASIFVGQITASDATFSSSVTAVNFFGSASYAHQALSASYVAGSGAAPGEYRDILINDSGSIGRTSSFFYNEHRVLSLYGNPEEPLPVSGGLYVNFTDGRLKFCVDETWLYYTSSV